MTHGHFSDDDLEFVITRPQTPRLWQNFAWNDCYLAGMDQTGRGTALYHEPGSERRTDLISRRELFVVDEQGAWNVGILPLGVEPDTYRCRVGLHYNIIEQSLRGIRASWRIFVPPDIPGELWTVTLANTSGRPREIRIHPGVHFMLDSFPLTCPPHGLSIDVRYDAGTRSLWATNKSYQRPDDNCRAFFATSGPVHAYDGVGSEVYGVWARDPLFLANGCSNSEGGDFSAKIGYFDQRVTLAPGQSVEWHYLLARRSDDRHAAEWTRDYFASGRVEQAFRERRERNASALGLNRLETSSRHVNRVANIWNQQQTALGARWTRIYFIGFRDILQDAQALMMNDAERGRASLINALAHQYACGRAIRGWAPFTPIHTSDCHVWITFTLVEYLKETGDFALLERKVPWFDGGEATVREHWIASLEYPWRERGERGLCKIFDCDWNDSLTIGEKGRGESVWLTQAVIYAMKESIPVLERAGLHAQAAIYRERIPVLADAVNACWDGRWYVRAYNDEGEAVGSASNPRCGEIYINSQTWAALSGVADEERLSIIDAAMDEKLFTANGYKTCHPGFTRATPGMGRIGGANPGVYENGSAYCHSNAFKIVADIRRGHHDRAWDLAKRLFTDPEFNPHCADSGAEPYAFTNQFTGPLSVRPGRSLSGWITGTASWMQMILLKHVPGVHPEFDGLRVEPALPVELGRVRLRRVFRGAVYHFDIAIDPALDAGHGVVLELNGRPLAGAVVPVMPAESENHVTVRYSDKAEGRRPFSPAPSSHGTGAA